MQTFTLIPGDGIGPEITQAVEKIFQAAELPLSWETRIVGATALEHEGELIPQSTLDSIRKNGVALKGPCATPVGKGFRSVNVSLRKEFDLYANQRPAKTIPNVPSRFEDVDIVLFRENLEGLYAGLEIYDERFQIADAIRRISKRGSERIVRAAFEFARKEGRSKVTLLHKANIMKHADGLFLQTGREVAQEYADIEFEDMIIDNAFMQMVVRPERFDVLVTTNMFGDIMSDLLAGMVGGLGVVAGANIGDDAAIFEAVHGTAPDIAGQGSANPTGILLSSLMMLRHMGLFQEADQLAQALMATLSEPAHCTPDLGGNASTIEFADHLINALFRVKNLQHS